MTRQPSAYLFLHTALVRRTVSVFRRLDHAVNVPPTLSTQPRPRACVVAPDLDLALTFDPAPSAIVDGVFRGSIRRERTTTSRNPRSTRSQPASRPTPDGGGRAAIRLGEQVWRLAHRGEGWSIVRERPGGRAGGAQANDVSGARPPTSPRAFFDRERRAGCYGEPTLIVSPHADGNPRSSVLFGGSTERSCRTQYSR